VEAAAPGASRTAPLGPIGRATPRVGPGHRTLKTAARPAVHLAGRPRRAPRSVRSPPPPPPRCPRPRAARPADYALARCGGCANWLLAAALLLVLVVAPVRVASPPPHSATPPPSNSARAIHFSSSLAAKMVRDALCACMCCVSHPHAANTGVGGRGVQGERKVLNKYIPPGTCSLYSLPSWSGLYGRYTSSSGCMTGPSSAREPNPSEDGARYEPWTGPLSQDPPYTPFSSNIVVHCVPPSPQTTRCQNPGSYIVAAEALREVVWSALGMPLTPERTGGYWLYGRHWDTGFECTSLTSPQRAVLARAAGCRGSAQPCCGMSLADTQLHSLPHSLTVWYTSTRV
jgi:hypothetical protein